MTEEQRLKIVEDINTKKIMLDVFEHVKRKQQLLIDKSDDVKKYADLLSQEKSITLGMEPFLLSRIINNEFTNSIELSPMKCNHPIWLYGGSYAIFNYLCKNGMSEYQKPEIIMHDGEDYRSFAYNVYYCLECGMPIQVRNWKEFENTQQVLRSDDGLFDADLEMYQYLYYQYLYEMPSEEAQKTLIMRHKKDHEL